MIEKQTVSFTIDEFCRRHCLSPRTYRHLRMQNLGPTEMLVSGTLVRVSAKAEEQWVAAMEARRRKAGRPVPDNLVKRRPPTEEEERQQRRWPRRRLRLDRGEP